MYCKHCGASVEGHHSFCPTCGQKLSEEPNRFLPGWIKALIALALLGAAFAGYLKYNQDDPKEAIVDQLNSLKSNQYTQAYYGYASKDFQKSTPLEQFKEVIHSYPPLSQVKEINVQDQAVEDDTAHYTLNLKTDDDQSFNMEYQLVKEDGSWKIVYFRLLENKPSETEHELKSSPQKFANNPMNPIDTQLDLLRSGSYKEAYDLTHTEFKKITSFKAFEQFLNANPILTKFVSYRPLGTQNSGNFKKVKVILTSVEGTNRTLEYTLGLGNKDPIWTIRGMELFADDKAAPQTEADVALQDPALLEDVMNKFVDALKSQDYKAAYEEYTSEAFKNITDLDTFIQVIGKYPAFTNNESIEIHKSSFKNNVGTVIAILKDTQGEARSAQFDFTLANNVWKIEQILIYNAPEKDSLTIKEIQVGTEKDKDQMIVNPSDTLVNPPRTILVNVYLNSVRKGDVISAQLINDQLKIKSPVVDHTIDIDAYEYIAFFTFTGPETGWPAGSYNVIAESSNHAKQTHPITIE